MIRRATIDYQSHRPQQQKNFDTIRDAPLNLEDDHISHIQLLFAGPHFRHILLMALTIKSPSSLCPAPFLLPRAATVLITFYFYSPLIKHSSSCRHLFCLLKHSRQPWIQIHSAPINLSKGKPLQLRPRRTQAQHHTAATGSIRPARYSSLVPKTQQYCKT